MAIKRQESPNQISTAQSPGESENRLALLVEHSPIGIIEWDINYIITAWNPGVEKIFGFSRGEALGKLIISLICPVETQEQIKIALDNVIANKTEYRNINENITKHQKKVLCQWNDFPIINSQGKVIGGASIVSDITQKTQDEKIRTSIYQISESANLVQNFDELLRSIHQIINQLIPAQNYYIALYNKETDTISFPYFVDEFDQNPGIIKKGTGLTEVVLRSGQPLLASPEKYDELEAKGEVKSKGTPSVDWLGVPLKFSNGEVFGVLVVQTYTEGIRFKPSDQDILSFVSTQVAMVIERRQGEENLRKSEQRFRTLVENVGEGTGVTDLDENFTFANPAADDIFGVQPGGLLGHNLKEFVDPVQLSLITDETKKRKQGEKSTYELEIKCQNGERHSLLVTATPQTNAVGEFTGTFGIFRDITDRKKIEEELRFRSTHDMLTGLYNRAFFESEMERIQLSRYFPISILMSDLDGLKYINDKYGHAEGDALLRRAAGVLVSCFRADDIIARIGGDEFAVLLPGVYLEIAKETVERFQNMLIKHNKNFPERPLSFSVGISTAQKGTSLSDVFKIADELMYQEKNAKKNLFLELM